MHLYTYKGAELAVIEMMVMFIVAQLFNYMFEN